MISRESDRFLKLLFKGLIVALIVMVYFLGNGYFSAIILLILPSLAFSAFFSIRRSWLLYGPLVDLFCLWRNRFDLPGTQYSEFYHYAPLTLFIILIIGIIVELVMYVHSVNQSKNYFKEISEAKVQKEALMFNESALKDSGMTEAEQDFFRSEMRKHHAKYEYLCDIPNKVKLTIPNYKKDMTIMNGIFNELLNAPEQLLAASDFLYQDLPDYLNIVKGLVNLSDNVVKDKEDETVIEKAEVELQKLSGNLEPDFKKVTDNERKELVKSLEQAKSVRERVNEGKD
ncbi:5-bromo-4-chloroindolyl phosphate hydrolysis family protein [Companilactobacillus bobalius]|uniref:5-bromo-4-chloroindolyl phosphate hydrolase n=2 Tax=Companilactobacillus bobalius TaxID=2801451 RepID=A0A202F938_9LACO|nr:5-bromo-4-chloroindolyl phosphate hydrolysis family protein [Companilactobacillus bobalius]KAE9559634.1 hypothetical protein ATN92_12220 [Companilactobacillus bobalius]KAE9561449.1 hypothetical protein ATN92_05040 [Companilactobacillus bobalius]OVE97009.1 hypothetical protein LKACC16343_02019 [Companilactobacillus bobalius]GEO59436.1 hypothetical protein LBO01_25650 [Companilactobacillus paralimentarius]